MKKLIKLMSAALLACGLVSSLPAGFYLNWNARGSNNVILQVDVPSACSVSITAFAYTSGGSYSQGAPYIYYQGVQLTNPAEMVEEFTNLEDAGIIGSFEPPLIYSGMGQAYSTAVVWGGSDNFNKVESRGTSYSPVSSETGTATAGTYYIEVLGYVVGDGEAGAEVSINW